MIKRGDRDLSQAAMSWLSSTPRRTFVLYPLLVASLESWRHGGLHIHWVGLPLLVWGYLFGADYMAYAQQIRRWGVV